MLSTAPTIIGPLRNVATIAVRSGIRELATLRRLLGRGNWRKIKGEALVRLPDGTVRLCELHWYEAHGIGKRKIKIKRILD